MVVYKRHQWFNHFFQISPASSSKIFSSKSPFLLTRKPLSECISNPVNVKLQFNNHTARTAQLPYFSVSPHSTLVHALTIYRNKNSRQKRKGEVLDEINTIGEEWDDSRSCWPQQINYRKCRTKKTKALVAISLPLKPTGVLGYSCPCEDTLLGVERVDVHLAGCAWTNVECYMLIPQK